MIHSAISWKGKCKTKNIVDVCTAQSFSTPYRNKMLKIMHLLCIYWLIDRSNKFNSFFLLLLLLLVKLWRIFCTITYLCTNWIECLISHISHFVKSVTPFVLRVELVYKNVGENFQFFYHNYTPSSSRPEFWIIFFNYLRVGEEGYFTINGYDAIKMHCISPFHSSYINPKTLKLHLYQKKIDFNFTFRSSYHRSTQI